MAKIIENNGELRIVRSFSRLFLEGFGVVDELETFLESTTAGFQEKVDEVIERHPDLTNYDKEFLRSLPQELSNVVSGDIESVIAEGEEKTLLETFEITEETAIEYFIKLARKDGDVTYTELAKLVPVVRQKGIDFFSLNESSFNEEHKKWHRLKNSLAQISMEVEQKQTELAGDLGIERDEKADESKEQIKAKLCEVANWITAELIEHGRFEQVDVQDKTNELYVLLEKLDDTDLVAYPYPETQESEQLYHIALNKLVAQLNKFKIHSYEITKPNIYSVIYIAGGEISEYNAPILQLTQQAFDNFERIVNVVNNGKIDNLTTEISALLEAPASVLSDIDKIVDTSLAKEILNILCNHADVSDVILDFIYLIDERKKYQKKKKEVNQNLSEIESSALSLGQKIVEIKKKGGVIIENDTEDWIVNPEVDSLCSDLMKLYDKQTDLAALDKHFQNITHHDQDTSECWWINRINKIILNTGDGFDIEDLYQEIENALILHYINRLGVIFEKMYEEKGKCVYNCNMYCDEEVEDQFESDMVIELSSAIADTNNQEFLHYYLSQEIENYKTPKTPKELCILNVLEELLSLDYSEKLFMNNVEPMIEKAFENSFKGANVLDILGSKNA